MRIPRLSLALSALAAVLLLAGCGPTDQSTTSAPDGVSESEPVRVAVIPKGTAHVFWQTVLAGAESAGKEFNAEILWKGPPKETEYSKQMQIIEDFLVQDVDAFAIAPTEQDALAPVVERVYDSGKPTIVFDSLINTDKYHAYVATDNYEGGKLAAEEMAEILGGKGKIAIVLCAPGGASTLEREKGFRDTIQQDYPEIEIVAEKFGMSDRNKSLAVAEDMLTAHGEELDAFFGSNESSAVGALMAVKNAGLSGKIKIVGFDSSDQLISGLREGAIDALVVQNPYKMGYEAVRAAIWELRGREIEKRIDTGVAVVRRDNIDTEAIQAIINPVLD